MKQNVNVLYEIDTYNSRQNFLYKRSLFGLSIYTDQEVSEMTKEKLKRINKIYRKTQTVLNLWKQEKLLSITNQMIKIFFPNGHGYSKELLSYNYVDTSFICILSFKDLGINKKDIINKLITEKILPKNFYDLIPN